MKITFLGTGTSQGVPVITCKCQVCLSKDPRDIRLRTSVNVEIDKKTILIDAGPDFRAQMLSAKVNKIDAVLITHKHKDHIAGLDDIRAFNYTQDEAINLYANIESCNAIRREFYYAFEEVQNPVGPKLNLNIIDGTAFTAAGIDIIPVRVMHDTLNVLGFRIKDFVYITDAKTVAKDERMKLNGCKILVVNALQQASHPAHFNLEEAVQFADEIGAERTYFTHISHLMGKYKDVTQSLPKNVMLAYDSLTLEL